MLQGDASPGVRAMAAELVGAWAHSHPDAATALESAASGDLLTSGAEKAS